MNPREWKEVYTEDELWDMFGDLVPACFQNNEDEK